MGARVLLVRLDGIGDALVCTPLLEALRAAGHEVGIALSDRNAGIFVRDAFVATHVLERIPWPRHGATPASRERAEAEIASARYDVALIASEEPDAYTLARGIRERTGFTTGWAKPLKSAWVRARLTRTIARAASVARTHAHEVRTMFRLGVGLVAGEPSDDARALRGWIAGRAPRPERGGILVQLGEKWRTSGVGDDALGLLIASLRARDARFIAAPAERDALAARFPGITIDAPPATRDWIAAIDAAAAVVSVDTGAAHCAGMLGVPVVDVFPDAHADAQIRRWRPWASTSIVLRASQLVRDPGRLVTQALDAL
jgi:ADP-heptose:LPS heptosyltransferase